MDRSYGAARGGRRVEEPKPFWQRMLRRNRAFLLWFPAMLIYDDLVFRISINQWRGFSGFFYTLMFSLALGCILTFVSTLFVNKINVYIVIALTAFITLVYGLQIVYIGQFRDYFRWTSITQAGAVTEFWREALAQIGQRIVSILFLLVPLVFYCVIGRKAAPALGTPLYVKTVLLTLAVMFHLTALAGIALDDNADTVYNGVFSPDAASGYFGLMTETRLDIKYLMFGEPEFKLPTDVDVGNVPDVDPFGKKDPPTTQPPAETGTPGTDGNGDTTQVDPPKPVVYGDNVLDIDWDSLIANEKDDKIKESHEYFASLTPTKQNAYTGYFKGKNLIQLTLEGFTSKAVEAAPELFPTLSKMLNGGFALDNFYNSTWGGSTATGEYVSMTGVFYNKSKCLEMSAENYWPFALGNIFNELDYTVYAFHNNTDTYYGRDKSHPNFGYEYLAIHDDKDKPGECIGYKGDDWSMWPRSDLEMAKRTIDYYIDKAPFHVYYMTVSGHLQYTFSGNNMARLHRDEVEYLDYSENVKAYIACQLEVEYMLEYLIEQLEAKGQLENTVFVLNADHYPYGLADSELAELYGLPEKDISGNFDLYRNGAIIWCASMDETVHITKPCSAVDLIPTVLNLFGINYDSRLLMGVDLNSDADPIVILNCNNGYSSWNWINENGSYNTSTKKFTPAPGVSVDESLIDKYVSQMNTIVSLKRTHSFRILDLDYYRHVFPNGFKDY